MKVFVVILCLFSTFSYAEYSDKYISQSIKNEKVFYCFKDDTLKHKIVFDRYRNRLYHYPFDNYNNVKILKSERIDDENPVYKTTYNEIFKKKRIATFTLTTQGNDFWEATYNENTQKKSSSLDSTTYDLNKLDAICFDDLNN